MAALTLPSGGPNKWAELLRDHCTLGCTQKTGQNQKWMPQPCLLGGGASGRNCYATPGVSGVPKQGNNIRGAREEGRK